MPHPDAWMARARAWLEEDPDPDTRAEIEALLDAGDVHGLKDRFSGTLTFGTAGIRAVLGAGPLRMNRVVVRRVSRGIADHYADELPDARSRGVVVGHDARHKSRVFAEDAARVFLEAGYRVWLADGPVPTPVVPFATLDLGAAIGVMVTASHNPPEYNGYKLYGPDGAQIVPPADARIAARIDAVGPTGGLAAADLEAAREARRLVPLGERTMERYLHQIRGLAVHPGAARQTPLRVAYTPMHGVGAELAEAALAQAGFNDLHVVESQRGPDPDFPTVRFPNPEEPGAMDRLLELARRVEADVAFANDPDADRLAVAIPTPAGWQVLTGDQVGALLGHYLLSEGPAGTGRVVATTVVSSQLLARIAQAHGAVALETLTGFKWIERAALEHVARHGGRFVFGYEEALGYAIGDRVRDKDGIAALVLFAELTARAKAADRSVAALLEDLYRRFGLHLTAQRSLTLPGAAGLARIAGLMARFRADPPGEIGGRKVLQFADLAQGTGELPPADLLVFRLEGGARVLMRPSGTEPKLKSYYEVREELGADEAFPVARDRARRHVEALADAHQRLME